MSNHSNSLITNGCAGYANFQGKENKINQVYSIVSGEGVGSGESLQLIISLLVVVFSLLMILMLQRTRKLGELIMMVN